MLFALRQLGRSRLFAAIAVGTLALGIGATAAVFSALHAVVLRPLPFAAPERIVKILPTRRGESMGATSSAEFATARELRMTFEHVAGVVSSSGFTLTGGDTPEVVGGGQVTGDYLRVFGVSPEMGRGFVAADDEPGAPRVVVLSHRLWTRKFNADRAMLGRPIQLNGEPFSVIGVMPAAFDFTSDGDELWAPMRLSSEQLADDDGRFLQLVGRLPPGVSKAKAASAVDVVIEWLQEKATVNPGA